MTQLQYMWIAFYEDGSAFPQFDPISGEENMFLDVKKEDVIKFAYYPFTVAMAKKTGHYFNPDLHPVELNLKAGQKLIAYRQNKVVYGVTTLDTNSVEINYVLGYEDATGKHLVMIHQDGNIEVNL